MSECRVYKATFPVMGPNETFEIFGIKNRSGNSIRQKRDGRRVTHMHDVALRYNVWNPSPASPSYKWLTTDGGYLSHAEIVSLSFVYMQSSERDTHIHTGTCRVMGWKVCIACTHTGGEERAVARRPFRAFPLCRRSWYQLHGDFSRHLAPCQREKRRAPAAAQTLSEVFTTALIIKNVS